MLHFVRHKDIQIRRVIVGGQTIYLALNTEERVREYMLELYMYIFVYFTRLYTRDFVVLSRVTANSKMQNIYESFRNSDEPC